MQISGFFTIDEIRTATKFGAKFERLRGGVQSLEFKSEDDYDKWMKEQEKNHPDRWKFLITIKPKD